VIITSSVGFAATSSIKEEEGDRNFRASPNLAPSSSLMEEVRRT